MTAPVQRPTHGAPAIAGSGSIVPPSAGELLHAAILRPPALGWDGIRHTGARLDHLDTDPARNTPGVVQVVARNDFIAVIASQPGQALQGRSRLQPGWAVPVRQAQKPRASSETIYTWPAPPHQALAWAIARYSDNALTVWTCTRHGSALRRELAQLCGLPEEAVQIVSNGQTDTEGYDVAADAAVLSLSCGRPVRTQQEPDALGVQPIHIGVSAGAAQGVAGDGTKAPPGELVLSSSLLPAQRPSIASLLCGLEIHHPPERVVRITDYAPQSRFEQAEGDATTDSATLGLPAAAQVFAQESFFDESCRTRGQDPVQARLNAIADPTGRDLIASVAARGGWHDAQRSPRQPYEGRGFAYAHVVDQTQEPPREAWSAWVADVRVDPSTGAIDLTGLTVGHHTGALQPAATARIEDDVRNAASYWLRNAAGHDGWAVSDEGFALAQASTQVRLVEQGPVGLAWSRDAELPAAAAIANAIHDATGVRLRQAPFDAGELKQRLALAGKGGAGRGKRTAYALLGGIAATVGGLLVAAMPWRAAIAPVGNIDTSIYSAAAIERGRLVAAAGDCMVCHTADGGIPNAGGLALDTPFGKIYTTNITPDKETGIGAWSYPAFERAMRQGIHRDGRHLYPAFPYTAFAKMSDADMQSLYAYLMTQEPVRNQVAPTQLAFPYSVRPLLAGWNLLYHKDETYQPDPSQTTLWNRGAYLVQGMGHCAACHSPRNALGAEKTGEHFLAGGFAEGWEAPALNALSKAPIPWTEDELYRYLRTGYSPLHGVASGPMAPVVQSMAELPDQDVRAIAHYLGSMAAQPSSEVAPALQAALLEEQSRNDQRVLSLAGENLFQGACAVCHDAREGPPLFGARPSLALNTNLHSDNPDNAIQILLHGIDNPAMAELGYMPGFAGSMNDEQLVTLLEYMRARFAPDKGAWEGLPEKVRSLREEGGS